MQRRCGWADRNELVMNYHDSEWGVPVYEDQLLFELLSLEVFQAGLTWSLILSRRSALRKGLANFDIDQLAGFCIADTQLLLADPAMIRNRRKIENVIHNARQWQQQQLGEISPAEQLWDLRRQQPLRLEMARNGQVKYTFIKQTTALFYEWGIKGVGPKTITSFLQAAGFINDHEDNCYRQKEIYLSVHTTGRI